MASPRILMCPPDHYGIEYEINPWMNRSLGAVRAVAFTQWTTLRSTLAGLGVAVEQLAPVPGLPDLVCIRGLPYCYFTSPWVRVTSAVTSSPRTWAALGSRFRQALSPDRNTSPCVERGAGVRSLQLPLQFPARRLPLSAGSPFPSESSP